MSFSQLQVLPASFALAILPTLILAGVEVAGGEGGSPESQPESVASAVITSADASESSVADLKPRQGAAGPKTMGAGGIESRSKLFCPGTPMQLAGPAACRDERCVRVRTGPPKRAKGRPATPASSHAVFGDEAERVIIDRFSSAEKTQYTVANNGHGQLVIRAERPGFTRSLVYDYSRDSHESSSGQHAGAQSEQRGAAATKLIEVRAIPWFDDNVLLALAEKCEGEIIYRYAFSYSVRREPGNVSSKNEIAWFRSELILRTQGSPFRIVELRNEGSDCVEITLRRGRVLPSAKQEPLEEFIFVDVCPGGPFMEGRCILMDLATKESAPFGLLR